MSRLPARHRGRRRQPGHHVGPVTGLRGRLAGWQVRKDGSAEFNNLTIRGTFSGTDFELNSAGAFFYNGTPAAGNLIISVANAAGTDAFGNAYPLGIKAGVAGGACQVELAPSTGPGVASALAFPMTSPALASPPNVAAGVASTAAILELSGPELSASGDRDWVQVIMYSNDGAGTPSRMEFRRIDTSGGVVVSASYDSGGWVFADFVSITGGLSVNGSSDTGTPTNNSTSTNGLTDGTINGSSTTTGLPNGGIHGHIRGGVGRDGAYSRPGSYSVSNGQHSHGAGSYAVANGQHAHDMNNHAHPL